MSLHSVTKRIAKYWSASPPVPRLPDPHEMPAWMLDEYAFKAKMEWGMTYPTIPLLGFRNESVAQHGPQSRPIYFAEYRPQTWLFVWPSVHNGYYMQLIYIPLGRDGVPDPIWHWNTSDMSNSAYIDSLLQVWGVAEALCSGGYSAA
jgi:hypothetical protein